MEQKDERIFYKVVENHQYKNVDDTRILEFMMKLRKANFLHNNELKEIVVLAEEIFDCKEKTVDTGKGL